MSQPALSQAVAKLERQFGGALVERRARGVALTRRGAVVVRRIERGPEQLRAANQKLGPPARQNGADRRVSIERLATMAQLRALAAFAEAGSFSAAARLLGFAEPSVNRAARQLERVVEAPLFETGSHGVMLTRTGISLARHARLTMKEIESAIAEVKEAEGRFDGTIAVGSLPLAQTRILPKAVVAVTERHRQASVTIADGSYEALTAALLVGGIDLLIGALRPAPEAGLVQTALLWDDLSVVARTGHPLGRASSVGLSDLKAYPWVLPRARTPSRVHFERLFANLGPPPFGIVETGSLVALRGILLSSDRLTILSRAQIVHEEAAGTLGVLPFALAGTSRPIGLTTRAGWQPTRLQEEFLAALQHAAREETGEGRPEPRAALSR